MRISRSEFNGRIQHLLTYIREQKLTGVVLFDNFNILYFTGFASSPPSAPSPLCSAPLVKRPCWCPA
ncbi:MAG: aminopeptidase P family N-terminal domain-containing protein [Anaerolineales bacterium]|nr:aminopeptidase P family N-terminal domain-containing protein [Anaerolineales bacterium]